MNYQNSAILLIISCFVLFVVCRYMSLCYKKYHESFASFMNYASVFFGILSIVVGGYILICLDSFEVDMSLKIAYYIMAGFCLLLFALSKTLAYAKRIKRSVKYLEIENASDQIPMFFDDENTFYSFLKILGDDKVNAKAYKDELIVFIHTDDMEKMQIAYKKLEAMVQN